MHRRAFILIAALVFSGEPALAEFTAPLPKPRPHNLDAPRAPPPPRVQQPNDPAPVLTGTPVQRRARIRFCGAQWDAMERSGASVGTNWRDFSRQCFAQPLPANAPP